MKKWVKQTLATCCCIGIAFGFNGCAKDSANDGSSDDTQPQNTPVSEEVWSTVTAAVQETYKLEGTFTVDQVVTATGEDGDLLEMRYKVSHNAETNVGYAVDAEGDFVKIVQDGEEYCLYSGDLERPERIRGERLGSTPFEEIGREEFIEHKYNVEDSSVRRLVRWVDGERVPTYAQYEAVFHELFAADETATLTAYSQTTKSDELALTVEWKGTIVKNNKDRTVEYKDVVTVKEGRLVRFDSTGKVDGHAESVSCTFGTTFDQVGYDGIDLTGAPSISEGEQTRRTCDVAYYVGECNAYSTTHWWSSEGMTTAEQVEEILALTSSQYTIEGFYIDKEMIQPLTAALTDEEWKEVSCVYVKANVAGAFAQINERYQKAPTLIVKDEWFWFVHYAESSGDSVNTVGTKREAVADTATFTLNGEYLAEGRKAYVNGRLVTGENITIERGKAYEILYLFDTRQAEQLTETGIWFSFSRWS